MPEGAKTPQRSTRENRSIFALWHSSSFSNFNWLKGARYFRWSCKLQRPLTSPTQSPRTLLISMWFSHHSPGEYLPQIYTLRGVRRHSWGIFNVVHQPGFNRSESPATSTLWKLLPFILRFLQDIFSIAPRSSLSYSFGIIYIGVSPAISLYLCYTILDIMQEATNADDLDHEKLSSLKFLVIGWLSVAGISSIVERFVNETSLILDGHLRAHFMPALATASLRLGMNVSADYKIQVTLPGPLGFTEPAPGSDVLKDLSRRLQTLLNLCLQLSVLLYIVWLKSGVERHIFTCIILTFFVVLNYAPTNGVGSAGYTFWTDNMAYHRLSGLYSIIFSPRYRESLVRDGISEYIAQEFKRTSDDLGATKSDLFNLASSIPPPWYWAIARTLVVDYPLALYAFMFVWSPTPSSVATIAFLQHATMLLRQSIDAMQGTMNPTTIWDTMNKVRVFYEVIDINTIDNAGTIEYPNDKSSMQGMDISFRDVIVRYEQPNGLGANAVNKVSLDIKAGQLVVIVGDNGSGKSSLLKVITKLASPTSGSVKIDDKDIETYDANSLRRSIAFLSQDEEIYPVSLAENILMGAPNLAERQKESRHLIDEAAQLGGALNLIQRLGYGKVINPPDIISISLQGCGNGPIGDQAMAELRYHTAHRKEVKISDTEKQRLVASRTFMRLLNSDVRLLIVDDPTSAWDAIAERDLLNRFLELRKGKTVVMVNHRFGNVVQHADVILCMEAGKLVERGTHNELMNRSGHYTRLYNAQAAGA